MDTQVLTTFLFLSVVALTVGITFWAIDAESTELTAYSATVDVAAQTISFPAENPDATFAPS